MTRRYRAAIVGLRGIGGRRPSGSLHSSLGDEMPHSHAGAYAAVGGIDVVAVCDLKEELIGQFIDTWRDVWPSIRGYTDYRELLANEELDLISIATSDHKHADIFVEACAAGVRAIYCEKPLATTVRDADRMLEAAERHKVVVSVNHWTRWAPETLQALEAVRSGKIGKLLRIHQFYGGERAMLFRNGTYFMDMFCLFAGSEPVEVYAKVDDQFAGYGPRYAGDGGHDPRTDPGASVYVEFSNGVRGFLNLTQGAVDYSYTMLIGEKGFVRYSLYYPPLEIAYREDGVDGVLWRTYPHRPYYTRSGMVAAVAELLDVLERGGETSSPIRDAWKTVQLMVGALQSSHRGMPVRLPTVDE